MGAGCCRVVLLPNAGVAGVAAAAAAPEKPPNVGADDEPEAADPNAGVPNTPGAAPSPLLNGLVVGSVNSKETHIMNKLTCRIASALLELCIKSTEQILGLLQMGTTCPVSSNLTKF